jgi:hypothetical protein
MCFGDATPPVLSGALRAMNVHRGGDPRSNEDGCALLSQDSQLWDYRGLMLADLPGRVHHFKTLVRGLRHCRMWKPNWRTVRVFHFRLPILEGERRCLLTCAIICAPLGVLTSRGKRTDFREKVTGVTMEGIQYAVRYVWKVTLRLLISLRRIKYLDKNLGFFIYM